jgi:hypothetical protein
MKIKITNELQIDWMNHSSLVGEEGIPWHLNAAQGEGINASPRAAILALGELKEEILREAGFSSEKPVTHGYALFRDGTFSPWVEIVSNNKLFAGDVGPSVVYGRGICLPLPVGQVNDRCLKEALSFLKYTGEVFVSLDKQGVPVDFFLGSQIAIAQLYCFLIRRNRVTSFLEFFTEGKPINFSEKMSINCLVSPVGWPFVEGLAPINIPSELRQNLFMLPPVGIVAASGTTVKETRLRLKAALHQIQEKNSGNVQYRIDAHFQNGLVLTASTYGALAGNSASS